jgi:glycogen operon protein
VELRRRRPDRRPGVLTLRARQQRNFLATLLLSQGVPMISHGDELGRTQGGNNNGYAQDNEITGSTGARRPAARRVHGRPRAGRASTDLPAQPLLQRPPVRREEGAPLPDIAWLRPDGTEMQPEDWESGFGRAVGVFLNGDGIRERDRRGEEIVDRTSSSCSTRATTSRSRSRARSSARSGSRRRHHGQLTDTEPRRGGDRRAGGRSLIVLRDYQEEKPDVDHSVAASLAALTVPIDIVRSPAPQPSCRTDRGRRPAQRARLDRLQVRASFDLDAAAAVTGYLRDLGVDWAYLSPILQAASGSDHGYDVVDPTRVDADRGGADGLARFVAAARARVSASSWTSCRTIRASPIRPRTRGGGTS